ncbi:MAG: low temperature requirement protein A [Chloroflexi bacterium]|nr:low temperature requirement protein A [Chloroflexota bacterium]
MFELFRPPRFFQNVTFHRHTDRSVGWLELFYDLVYVATLIQIGNFLSDNVSLLGFAQFLVMIAVVWWAWTGETFYQNRFVVDDLLHRILVFAQIFAIATLGLSVSEAFGELYVQFTLAYVVTRLLLVLMYVRSYRVHPESRDLSRGYIVGFSFGILIWLASLILPSQYHWIGWLAGIGVELAVPFTRTLREQQRLWAVDVHHISERFGIFTIIVLGESFVKVLDDAQGITMGVDQILFSTVGLVVLYSLWWLYFSDTANNLIDFAHPLKPFVWVYSHLTLAAGLVAFGVGAKKLFASTVDHPEDAVNPDYRLLYTAAIMLYLMSLAVIDYGLDDETTPYQQTREALIHVVGAVIVGGIGLLATAVTAIEFVGLISLVMLAQVVYSIYQTYQIAEA